MWLIVYITALKNMITFAVSLLLQYFLSLSYATRCFLFTICSAQLWKEIFMALLPSLLRTYGPHSKPFEGNGMTVTLRGFKSETPLPIELDHT